ncbi:MAG TPA: PLP-dependent aminotransferase family protein [Symbiobacteriaceae bacterium]|nr:PLP-dependent aminotransferase family protein [Symbiobacteriaceae bacterium]
MFELDRSSSTPLYQQLRDQIRQRIFSGSLPAGTRLPPERSLANTLGVNRTTVVNAYRDLAAEGLVEGRVGHGTVVLPPPTPPPDGPVRPMHWASVSEPEDPVMADINAVVRRAGAISFAHGEMSPDLFPAAALGQLFGKAFSSGRAPLGYGPVAGYLPLREAIGARMGISPGEVLVLGGSQLALYLISRVLLQPGDTVVVEVPSYINTLGIFESAGVRVVPAPIDREGMQVDGLGEVFLRYRPKLLLTVPTFHNPLGVTMSLERRRQLLHLAARHQVGIVEDDPYGDLRFAGDPVPSLKALDPGGYVIYISSFSKSVSPGLRLAWLTAPPAVVERIAAARGILDFRAALLSQWVMEAFLREGHMERHLGQLRPVLARRCDALVAALKQYMPSGVTWQAPSGGYHLWCALPRPLRSRRLLSEAAREGVTFIPGDYYGPGEDARRGIRLNFTYPRETEIAEGVKRLAAAVRRILKEEAPAEESRLELSGPVV